LKSPNSTSTIHLDGHPGYTGSADEITPRPRTLPNIAKDDIDYLIAHEGSPGTTEMLSAPVTFDYFGSLAEHECHLTRLAKVTDADSFTDACMGLRECGYDDPSVVEKVKDAALVVGDRNLLDAIESIEGQDVSGGAIVGHGSGGMSLLRAA
jgi:hypothetical protein